MTGNNKQADTLNATAGDDMTFNAIYAQQMNFQKFLGIESNISNMKDQIMCLIAEATEALNELPWKHWKKNQELNIENFQDELVDVQLFLLNLCYLSGMSLDTFIIKCQNKQITNSQRQKENY